MGTKVRGVFHWGMSYASYAARVVVAFAAAISRRTRQTRNIALVVIAVAIITYASPYFVDALQCANQNAAEQALKCLDKIYDRARRDTNLAAIIIALAVTLAAWRPERPRRRPDRRRPTRTRAHNRPYSPRRPQLRRSKDDAP